MESLLLPRVGFREPYALTRLRITCVAPRGRKGHASVCPLSWPQSLSIPSPKQQLPRLGLLVPLTGLREGRMWSRQSSSQGSVRPGPNLWVPGIALSCDLGWARAQDGAHPRSPLHWIPSDCLEQLFPTETYMKELNDVTGHKGHSISP